MIERRQINGIDVLITEDAKQASHEVARLIAEQMRGKPDCVLGLATGGTPIMTYRELIDRHQRGDLDFSAVTTFNLDEYIGLTGDHDQSYRAFMNEELFDHINIHREKTHVPDGCADNVVQHCLDYEAMIRNAGGIDLQLLGLGHNGHIAFNEPGSPALSRTRQVDLTADTIEKNARFFESINDVPRHAITMGIATILEARQIVLLATGESKADAVAGMLEGPVTESMPAANLRSHERVIVVLDRAAAARIGSA